MKNFEITLNQSEKIEPLGNNIGVIVSDIHRFNTDTILLANFSMPKKNDRAVDLGSGCGTIPLIWSRENRAEKIYSVEIQKDACNMIERSIILNNLQDKLEIINGDIKALDDKLPKGYFDLVVCNPPYKEIGKGIVSNKKGECIARHECACSLDDITATASKLLQFSGRFCLCLRPSRLCDVILSMRNAKLEPKRLRFVHQRKEKEPKLFLIEGRKGAKPELRVMPPLYLEDESGNCSVEMKKIYGVYGDNKK